MLAATKKTMNATHAILYNVKRGSVEQPAATSAQKEQ